MWTWGPNNLGRPNALLCFLRAALATLALIVCLQPAQAEFRYVTVGKGKPLIIFVHGLWGDPVTSFRASDSSPTWAELMRTDHESVSGALPLSGVSTGTLAYPATCAGGLSIPQIGTRLATDMQASSVWDNHPSVIFIAHSLGGLVIQEMLSARRDNIPDRTIGVLLVATPVQGSDDAANLAKLYEGSLRDLSIRLLRGCPLISDLKSNTSLLLKIDNDWNIYMRAQQKQHGDRRLRVHCLYETLPTRGIRVIVSQGKGMTTCDGERYPVAADHETIIKPKTIHDENYKYARLRLADVLLAHKLLKKPTEPLITTRPVQTTDITTATPAKSDYVITRHSSKYIDGKGYIPMHLVPAQS